MTFVTGNCYYCLAVSSGVAMANIETVKNHKTIQIYNSSSLILIIKLGHIMSITTV